MSYSEQLNKLIKKSGLQINEIAKRCKEYGVDITPQYITILKNGKNKSASDDVSRAIAKACGAECEEILAVEAFIDKAPEYMQKFFEIYRKEMLESILQIFKSQLDENQYALTKAKFEELSIADFIVAMNNIKISDDKSIMLSTNDEKNIKVTTDFVTPFSIIMNDDSLNPLITKESQIEYTPISLDKINNGDIICYRRKGFKTETAGKCVVADDKKTVTIYPINPKYKPQTYSVDDIALIGKATRVVTKCD